MNPNATTTQSIFSPDTPSEKPLILIPGAAIERPAAIITAPDREEIKQRGNAFAQEITDHFISDFEKTETLFQRGAVSEVDKMVHVSTFLHSNDMIYMTYYANTKTTAENPNDQTARLVCCPDSDPDDKTFYDVQSVGDICCGQRVNLVYDTILAQIDADTLYILWTAKVGDTYYRLYRPFILSEQKLGEIDVNRFRVGDITNDFSTSGITAALSAAGIGVKTMYSDIGIMQKFTSLMEDGVPYYYTGSYSGDFNCIIKSRDFITWEYVAQPDFPNLSKWENAVYLLNDICYYFVRQHDETPYGFLSAYDLHTGTWEKPVLLADCQSRSDFIFYRGQLYLFHAPIDREHIEIVRINTGDITKSEVVLQAHMHTSCFYPFIQYYTKDELAMSYTVNRAHIRLAGFTLANYL